MLYRRREPERLAAQGDALCRPLAGTGRQRHLSPALALLLAFLTTGGCTQYQFRASDLPSELLPPRVIDVQKVNLSSVSDAPVSQEVVQPGDVIEVSMVTDYRELTSTTTPVRITDDGAAVVPLIGPVQVAGLTLQQAERAIAAEGQARGLFRNPVVTVTMKQPRTVQVTVVGAVDQPGVYPLARGNASLMAALVAAGGLAEEASSEVEIRRTAAGPSIGFDPALEGLGVVPASYEQTAGMSVMKVDLLAPVSPNPEARRLYDGDVIHVVRQPVHNVYVLGLVRKPGEFSMPPGEQLRLLDVIAMAGGASNPVADKVLVVRHPPDGSAPVNIKASIQQAKAGSDNLVLAAGDTIMIEQTPETVLIDALRSVVRFTFGGSTALF